MAFLLAKRLAGWRVTRWASLLLVVERVASAALFFLPVTGIHAGAGKTVDGSKDRAIWTVAKTTAVWATKRGRLQRQSFVSSNDNG